MNKGKKPGATRQQRNSQAAQECDPQIDIALLGHVSLDWHADGFTPGGTVFFAAKTAAQLGWRAGVLTRAAADFPFAVATDTTWIVQSSMVTTTFRNSYRGQARTQIIEAVAPSLQGSVPAGWQKAPVLLFGPVAQEIPLPWLAEVHNDLVGAVVQGWLRRWDEQGRVSHFVPPDLLTWLHYADVVTFSREDFGSHDDVIERMIHALPLVVETRDREGAVVYEQGRMYPVPPRPAHLVDPTGAGDIFTTAFLVRYREHGNPVAAARFANVVASFAVESMGASGIPTRAQVETYLAGESS